MYTDEIKYKRIFKQYNRVEYSSCAVLPFGKMLNELCVHGAALPVGELVELGHSGHQAPALCLAQAAHNAACAQRTLIAEDQARRVLRV